MSHSFEILTDRAFGQTIGNITQSLSRRCTAGFFPGFDGTRLYYEYFATDRNAPSVVIVHGLSEFTKKYYELTYYFLQQGYQVFLYDQRCHGFSQRLTRQRDLLHVDSFQDYVQDLDTFIQTVVRPVAQGPLYLFSHSMGGAVAVLYLHAHPEQVEKVILSAPMFQPVIGKVPYGFAKMSLEAKALFCDKKSVFNPSAHFNPEEALRNATDASQNRFSHNLTLRINEPMYQSTPMSLGWVINSLKLLSQLRRKKIAEELKTPVLLLSAEKDTVVRNRWHRVFADKCPTCRMEVIPGAGHALMNSDDAAVGQYVESILDFFAN